jgi:DNA-binding Xre family transcriptional regulator
MTTTTEAKRLKFKAKELFGKMTLEQITNSKNKIYLRGVSPATLNRIINATMDNPWSPTLFNLNIVCEVLNVNLNQIQNQ